MTVKADPGELVQALAAAVCTAMAGAARLAVECDDSALTPSADELDRLALAALLPADRAAVTFPRAHERTAVEAARERLRELRAELGALVSGFAVQGDARAFVGLAVARCVLRRLAPETLCECDALALEDAAQRVEACRAAEAAEREALSLARAAIRRAAGRQRRGGAPI